MGERSMSEELKQEAEQKEEQIEQQSEQKLSPVEQEALAQGWVPKEEFQGEEHKWVDAGEFIRRGELFTKIEHQSRELKEVRKALQGFKEHYTKVKETEYNNALRALKSEFKTANREGDFEKADKLELEIETVEKEAAVIKQQVDVATEAQTIHPEFASWVERNNWYQQQPHMKTFADIKGLEFAKLGLTPSEVLKKVEAEVRKEFPTKFTNPNRERPGAVEGSQSGRVVRGSSEGFQLTEQEERVMNSFVKQGVMTKAEYIKDLKSVKGLK
jgi:hypothetical protein